MFFDNDIAFFAEIISRYIKKNKEIRSGLKELILRSNMYTLAKERFDQLLETGEQIEVAHEKIINSFVDAIEEMNNKRYGGKVGKFHFSCQCAVCGTISEPKDSSELKKEGWKDEYFEYPEFLDLTTQNYRVFTLCPKCTNRDLKQKGVPDFLEKEDQCLNPEGCNWSCNDRDTDNRCNKCDYQYKLSTSEVEDERKLQKPYKKFVCDQCELEVNEIQNQDDFENYIQWVKEGWTGEEMPSCPEDHCGGHLIFFEK